MKVHSHLKTTVAYDGGREAKAAGIKHTVTLSPGENILTDADEDLLHRDENFGRHYHRGHYHITREQQPEPDPVADAPEPAAKAKGGKKVDSVAAPTDQTVVDFLALKPEDQAIMESTLTPAQLAEVNKARATSK